MGLRQTAESDLAFILEDDTYGFGYPITITNPAGSVKNLTGYSNDIAQLIDPDTGQAVSGRLASAVVRISTLFSTTGGPAFTSLPVAIPDESQTPWLVEFNDINGNPYKFKVAQSNPDRALGIISLILETYEDAP